MHDGTVARRASTLRRPDGTPRPSQAAWVIGAGGAHSLTRESMGGDLTGTPIRGRHSRLTSGSTGTAGRDGSALIASAAGYVLLAPLPDGRWITFIGDLNDAEARELERDPSAARHRPRA